MARVEKRRKSAGICQARTGAGFDYSPSLKDAIFKLSSKSHLNGWCIRLANIADHDFNDWTLIRVRQNKIESNKDREER